MPVRRPTAFIYHGKITAFGNPPLFTRKPFCIIFILETAQLRSIDMNNSMKDSDGIKIRRQYFNYFICVLLLIVLLFLIKFVL